MLGQIGSDLDELNMNIPSADDCAWNAVEGTRNGTVSIIRYRPDMEEFLGEPNYPQRLVIIWEYQNDNTSGMPSTSEIDEMSAFENTIVNALDPDRSAILVLVLTNSGVREWHFYVQNVKSVGSKINEALSESPDLPISLQVEDDSDWGELKQVYALCSQ